MTCVGLPFDSGYLRAEAPIASAAPGLRVRREPCEASATMIGKPRDVDAALAPHRLDVRHAARAPAVVTGAHSVVLDAGHRLAAVQLGTRRAKDHAAA